MSFIGMVILVLALHGSLSLTPRSIRPDPLYPELRTRHMARQITLWGPQIGDSISNGSPNDSIPSTNPANSDSTTSE